mgnify:CR=1 FL=1
MIIEMLKAKIHRATVTNADLNYNGSLTLDENLMDVSGLHEYEKIQVLDITNGSRIETYIIKGERGSGEVCINGAAAHLIQKDDLVIIASYCQIKNSDIKNHIPRIVFVNKKNQVVEKNIDKSILV